ncbi:WD40 repeat domain-containing protein [Pirellulales bacterium]|nr:WD40 repeat domain-containing protein [Pirellulales bacterium]
MERTLAYLTASRRGLTENEILEILFVDPVFREVLDKAVLKNQHKLPANANRIPTVIWSRLRFDLAPYLADRGAPGGDVVTFYHRQVAVEARKRYCTAEQELNAHRHLANYFGNHESSPYFHESIAELRSRMRRLPLTPGPVNIRKVDELPFHLTQVAKILSLARSEERSEVEMKAACQRLNQLFTDFVFLESKAEGGMVFDLLADCENAGAIQGMEDVRIVRSIVMSALPCILARPQLAGQAICNRILWSKSGESELSRMATAASERMDQKGRWLRAEAPLPESDGFVIPFRTMRNVQAVSNNGKYFAACTTSGDLEVYDLSSGSIVDKYHFREPHVAAVTIASELPVVAYSTIDGQILTSAGDACLAGRPQELHILALDDRTVVAARRDNTLVAWDAVQDVTSVIMSLGESPIKVLRATSDGRTLVAVAGDRPQRIAVLWRRRDSWHHTWIDYDGPSVIAAALSCHAERLLLACKDRALRVLAVDTSKELRPALHYETRANLALRGKPEKCALGFGRFEEWAYFATADGHIARWNWNHDVLTQLNSYREVDEDTSLTSLEVLSPGDRLFVSTPKECQIVSNQPQARGHQMHPTAVTACDLVGPTEIVSASQQDQTVRWYSSDGLEPLNVRAMPPQQPTALAHATDSEGLFVGTRQGHVFYVLPNGDCPAEPILSIREPVVSLFVDGASRLFVAGTNGTVVRTCETGRPVDIIRLSTGMSNQRKMIPAWSRGMYWNLQLEARGDVKQTISLGIGSGHTRTIYTSYKNIADFAVSKNDDLLCVVGETTKVIHSVRRGLFRRERWVQQYCENIPADHVAFFEDGDSIVLTRSEIPWLEIRRVTAGMELALAIELPSPASSLCVRGTRVVVGLKSGSLMSLRVRGDGPAV